MKLTTIAFAAVVALCGSFAYAQSGAPSGAWSTTGDPAASSANPVRRRLRAVRRRRTGAEAARPLQAVATLTATRAGTRCPIAVKA